MILGHFEPGVERTMEEICAITGKEPGRATWQLDWALWFVRNGYEVKHYSRFDFDRFAVEGIEYIRSEYGDDVARWQDENSDVAAAQLKTPEYLRSVQTVNGEATHF